MVDQVNGNTVTVTDKQGRDITIRKLNALDRLRLFEALGASLSENLAYMGYALTAASVIKIGTEQRAFPANKRSVEASVDMLGDDGLEAAGTAYRDNFTGGETGDLANVKN
jgi:hypothetical protein